MNGNTYENLKMALNTLRANKLRSVLTVVGVVIGVWTVMAIASLISGIDMSLTKEIESFGTRSIFLSKYQPGITIGRRSREERMRKHLTYDDAIALRSLSAVELTVPFLDVSNDFFGRKINVSANGKTSSAVRLEGTLPDIERAGTEVLVEGRFFTQFENDTSQNVCVIKRVAAENFFPYENPVGKMIKIGNEDYRIVGLIEKREQMLGGDGSNDINNGIFLPFNVARKLKPNEDDIFILAVAKEGRIAEAKDQIRDLLRIRRQVEFDKPDNFGMATADSIIEQFRSITFGVALAMVVISSVGLMVGGIGVMNIMLVSVTERTKEIGTRKAIGARRKDILLQFLIEAMTLTGMGGLIGLTLGWITSLLIRLVFPSYIPLWAPIAGLVASIGIGLIFGLFPAWKAARLDPIEALRYE